MTILAPHPVDDWDDREPTDAELFAIEAEWASIAAELSDLDDGYDRFAVTLDVADLDYRAVPAQSKLRPVTVIGFDADGAILDTATAFHAECTASSLRAVA